MFKSEAIKFNTTVYQEQFIITVDIPEKFSDGKSGLFVSHSVWLKFICNYGPVL